MKKNQFFKAKMDSTTDSATDSAIAISVSFENRTFFVQLNDENNLVYNLKIKIMERTNINFCNIKISLIRENRKFTPVDNFELKHNDKVFATENAVILNESLLFTNDSTIKLYDGQTKNGIPHGKGIEIIYCKFCANNCCMCSDCYTTKYVGNFENGEYNGEGMLMLYDYNCNLVRTEYGIWVNNYTQGWVEIYDFDIERAYLYEGEVLDGMFFGKGKITYLNGDIIEGDFINNELVF